MAVTKGSGKRAGLAARIETRSAIGVRDRALGLGRDSRLRRKLGDLLDDGNNAMLASPNFPHLKDQAPPNDFQDEHIWKIQFVLNSNLHCRVRNVCDSTRAIDTVGKPNNRDPGDFGFLVSR
ncbi:hypothetical protein [Methylobacterium sp. WL12]|uniref:hypothetical protein n=1 Tax=Methylobacterium sp. WL12 TaxID=2603890 RepID=UPI0011C9774F|nr:hypothetical protein [Methylobacterium sp. WL12]